MRRRVRSILVVTVAVAIAFGLSGAWAKPPHGGNPPGQGNEKKQKVVNHKARQKRPVQLGVSGGSAIDIANGYCCSGTLGALVEDGADQYILSNTHVFAGDSVGGDNGAIAQPGDPITQPGYIDVRCRYRERDVVAELTDWIAVNPGGTSSVDAAIAQVLPGTVDPDGKILEIGIISSGTVAAYTGQPVKKSGRTSGLTKGSVDLIDATVEVEYSDECAGNTFLTTYTGQILVIPGAFLQGGDSGSLMVEDVDVNPRPVGLLYAGSDFVAVANPIDDVLNALGVSVVGVVASATGVSGDSEPGPGAQGLARASEAKAKHATRLMQVPGAIGHAVGLSSDPSRRPVVTVLVEQITAEARRRCPQQIDDVPVELMEVGKIVAY